MERSIFEVKLERNEWIKLNFIIGYRTKAIIWITIIGIGMLYTVVDYLIWNSFETKQFPIAQLIFAVFILGVIPISTFINASNNIKSNLWVSEKSRYIMDSSQINVKGDSYEVSLAWEKIKSITELKDWFIINIETNKGFFIPKRIFKSKQDLDNFRKNLKETSVINKKLK